MESLFSGDDYPTARIWINMTIKIGIYSVICLLRAFETHYLIFSAVGVAQ